MLVLGRKPGDKVIVGDAVFTILEIKGGRVAVGIEAPDQLPILRGELARPHRRGTRGQGSEGDDAGLLAAGL